MIEVKKQLGRQKYKPKSKKNDGEHEAASHTGKQVD